MADECPYQLQDGPSGRYYNDIFCTKCFTHERFFSGGGSWSPDLCPCGCEDTTVWYKMDWLERAVARKKYKKDLEKWQKNL